MKIRYCKYMDTYMILFVIGGIYAYVHIYLCF